MVFQELNGRVDGDEGLGPISHCHTAFVSNGLGRYAEALAAAERAWKFHDELGVSALVLPELIEAACRTGKTERALRALADLTRAGPVCASDWARGIEARARALVSEGAVAERLYQQAIEHLARAPVRMDLARGHLLYGEWLRRENRRMDARDELRTAYGLCTDIGARAFYGRARRELLATGETVRKRTVETRCELTAQEAEIVRLAGHGRTNPEIGAELFISPRTVEWHLRKVYPKLGIRSRRELRIALPGRLPVASYAS
jgi:ATP/maltotriose-dependent transcriptional regulator MalT